LCEIPSNMNKDGPIVVIEDDLDDQHVFSMVFKDLHYPNEIVFLSDGEAALHYLNTKDIFPFLVFSDINLPKLDGIELRKLVHANEDLSKKCIPYLFFTTSANKKSVSEAYATSVQGFFIKPMDFGKLKNTIRKIVEYWQECYSPNDF